MIVKKHISSGKLVLAVCDKDILGQKIEENDLQLDLSSDFYKGKEITDEELERLMKRSYIVNVAGKKGIDFFIKKGILDEDAVMKINNVPHVQIFIGMC